MERSLTGMGLTVPIGDPLTVMVEVSLVLVMLVIGTLGGPLLMSSQVVLSWHGGGNEGGDDMTLARAILQIASASS